MVKIAHTCFLLLLSVILGSAESFAFDHSHSLWSSLLRTHVSDGLVDYQSLQEEQELLNSYLESLDSVSSKDMETWSRDEQLAFWINAYNAFTVRVILDHYPISTWTVKGLVVPRNSIIQIHGAWKKLSWEVAGESLTLDQIEHTIIRPRYQEPRIHFSIVCASIGCPDLRREAFVALDLEQQLHEQTLAYLGDPDKGVRFDFEERRISVSRIFKWFTEDFAVYGAANSEFSQHSGKARIVLGYLSPYFPDTHSQALLRSENLDFDYLSYDWTLNDYR